MSSPSSKQKEQITQEAKSLLEHKPRELPSDPPQTDEQRVEQGREARNFLENKGSAYFLGLIDRRINQLQCELLDLSSRQTERFQEVKRLIYELEILRDAASSEKSTMESLVAKNKG